MKGWWVVKYTRVICDMCDQHIQENPVVRTLDLHSFCERELKRFLKGDFIAKDDVREKMRDKDEQMRGLVTSLNNVKMMAAHGLETMSSNHTELLRDIVSEAHRGKSGRI
jgi:hypothetical protein